MVVTAEPDLFRAHFEHLPGAAFIWQRDGNDFRVIAHNAAAAGFGDSDLGTIIGRSALEMAEFDPSFPDYLYRAAGGGGVLEKENDVRFETGLVRTIRATFVPVSEDIVVVHGQDVTDARATENRLRDSEARFRALVEATPDSILRMDADARILDVHYPKELDPPPWDPAELIGRTVGDIYGPQAQAQQSYYNREAIRTGKTQICEVRFHEQGRTVHLESRVVRIDENEVVVTSRDISDRAEVEGRRMIQEQQELSRLSHEIHDGLAQLLTGAHLSVENIRRTLEKESSGHAATLAEVSGMIRQAVRQARNLSQDVSPVPAGTGLFDALYLAVHHAKQRYDVRCEFAGNGHDDGVSQVAIAHLYQIAREAIRNAVRHGGARTIRLSCEIDDDRLMLAVEDDGTGLSDATNDSYGIGLRVMRYRAGAIGGSLSIGNASTSRGVVVRCVCPLIAVSREGWRFPEP